MGKTATGPVSCCCFHLFSCPSQYLVWPCFCFLFLVYLGLWLPDFLFLIFISWGLILLLCCSGFLGLHLTNITSTDFLLLADVDQIYRLVEEKSHSFPLLCLRFSLFQNFSSFASRALRLVSVVYVQEKLGFLVFRYTWMGLLLDFSNCDLFCVVIHFSFPGRRFCTAYLFIDVGRMRVVVCVM